MPIYEYLCPVCQTKFERLRPASSRDDPIICPQGHEDSYRIVSIAVAFSKDEFGDITTAGRVDSGLYLSENYN